MKRRIVMAVVMSTLVLASVIPGTASARSPERFGRVDVGGRTPHLDRLPSLQGRNRIVHVFVELAGSPVAAAMGAALDSGRELSEGQKASLRAPLLQRQAAIKTQLRTLGASIEGSFTDVLNAVRIRVPQRQLSRIAALPGVTRVSPVIKHFRDNSKTAAYIGADTTWGETGFTGEGVKIAIIDSGLNYYHRDFDGPSGYKADNGLNTADGNFPTAKVVRGHDFVGDDYNPDDPSNDTPNPDPDPLDCKDPDSPNVQHGTHVAGTAAGMGVLSDGSTYHGPYDATTLSTEDFRIGPGMAPEALLMAYRVFGCDGGTLLVVDAVEKAVRQGADVINMSLGSSFGNPGSADALAVDNASLAGTTVVMSAGNSAPSAYITGSPGVATRGISVAALDANEEFPSAIIDMATGADITAINANGNTTGMPVMGELNVFEDNPATPCDGDTGEGCEESGTRHGSYVFNGWVPGQIPVTFRGNGARIDRAIQGDEEGAEAVIMVNNSGGFPPFEGPISGANIPFLGVPSGDAARFDTDEGEDATISEGPGIENEFFQHTADFTSGGPRRIDSMIKPDVAAPGVSTFSANGATTRGGKSLSGTSMASPAVAGVAALVIDAHPSWSPAAVKAAIMGTASTGNLDPYEVRIAGSGVARPRRAVDTQAYAVTTPGASSLVFGDLQVGQGPPGPLAYAETLELSIVNRGASPITYDLSNNLNTPDLGINVDISPSMVTVPGGERRTVEVRLELSESEVDDLPSVAPFHGPLLAADDYGQVHSPLTHVAGAIIADPTTGGPGVYNLRIPWLVAPRGVSDIDAGQKSANTPVPGGWDSDVELTNHGLHEGIADVYAWGLLDADDGLDGIDLRAAGVQSIDPVVCDSGADEDDACLIFAVNTWGDWNNASENEFDILIDKNRDEVPDFAVIGVDIGLVFGVFEGVYGSIVLNLNTGVIRAVYLATAPNNSGTMLLPALASDLKLKGDGRFDYIVASFDVYDFESAPFQFDLMTTGQGSGPQWARFWAHGNPISQGDFEILEPGESTNLELSVSEARYDARRGMKGWMVVTMEDKTRGENQGQTQADLMSVGETP